MDVTIKVILGILSMLPVLTTIHFLLASHFAPRWLYLFTESADDQDGSRVRARAAWVYMLATMLGFGVLIYGGTLNVLWWMPGDWISVDEDGYATHIRHIIAAALAFWLGIYIPTMIMRSVGAKASHR